MFGRKSHGDVKKSAQKILDPKKDHVTRLKHLRIVLESYDASDAKSFFEQYYSVIYFLFHEGFTNVETSLGQRANKAHREELDYMLFILEKILVLLPEMIHKRWQLHSIGRIMRKLLHGGNSLKLRREGMRLFLMWYEILMDNATEECHKMFRSLVPKMSPSPSSDNLEADFFIGRTFSNTKVTVPDVYPILPSQSGEKQPDNLSKWLLEGLLSYMVSEVSKIRWNNHDLPEYCFKFLFDKFKDHYLPEIFPGLNRSNSIYEPCLDLPECTVDGGGTVQTVALCQEAVVKWMTNYTASPTVQNSGTNQNGTEKCDVDMIENGQCTGQDADRPIPGSNASTLSTASSYMENCSNGSSACSDDHLFTEQDIVRIVLYSSRENVNIVHEVFRQAFLFPFHHSNMVRRVIHVYRSWFQSDVMPVFMQDKKRSPSLSNGTSSVKDINRRHSSSSVTSGQVNCQLEQTSTALALEVNPRLDVRAGLQKVLQVFITNSANLFMIEGPASVKETTEQLKLEDQVDLCKRVLAMYRYMVTNVEMDRATWEQLLLVLLKVTSIIMTVTPPVYREKSLSGRLAEYLFKTLILAWVKANLNIQVSELLWKQFLGTLSSLTNWNQLIREWSKTMEMLTRVLARYIYAIDLRDLPLDKLSEQKVKRLRGAKNAGSVKTKDRTLSRSWMKQIIGGDGNSKLSQQLPKPSTVSAVASAAVLASFTNGILMGGSNRGLNLVGGRLETTMTMRQRSRSGESSLMCNSQLDLSSICYPPNSEALVGATSIPRSSSDSSIMIDPNKVKVSGLCIATMESHEIQLASNAKEENNLTADDEDISPQSHPNSEPNASDCMDEENTGDCHMMSVTDTTSVTSTDSNLPHYQKIVNRSGDSCSSFCMEQSSCSDRSDTEVLLRVSDSGSASSHSIHRSKRKSFNQATDSSIANQVDEEDEEEDKDMEEDDEEERLEGGVSAVGTVEESLDDDDTEDEGTVHSFEERQTKDTQDRDSLRIDDNDTLTDLDVSKSNGKLSILAGGSVTGWTPDVAVVLWHRMLGSLGNINDIKNSDMHAQVYEYLCDLLDTFIKVRENQGVSKDNQRTPPEPTFVPPVLMLAPWLFEALNLPDQYNQGKLLAYQLLCTGTLRRHDVEISADHLHRFYLMLHQGLTHATQDVTNVLIRYCNAKFFSLPLSGSTLMMLDFIYGAKMVLAQPTDVRNSPRAEAMSFLGSLLCFPNHLPEIRVLEPNSKELTVINCTDLKDHIITILLKYTRKEPTGPSRCIALSCLGIYLYEELCHETLHPKSKDAFDVLLSALKFNDKAACQVTAHVLTMLSDHLPLLLLKLPEIPGRVVKDLTVTIALLLPVTEKGSSEDSKKTASQVLVNVMFTLLEWCMRLPSAFLLTPTAPENKCLLHQVFDVLNMVVNGSQRTAAAPSQSNLQPMDSPPDDKDIPQTSQSVPSTPMASVDINADVHSGVPKVQRQDDHLLSSTHQKSRGNGVDTYSLRLAARTIMLHLINYLYHFPMSANNASQMNSEVQEYHDSAMEEVEPNDLPSQILASSNTQFFVINNMTLMSFVEIPAQADGGADSGVTAGLATEKTVCRVIVRDPSGKHCWDSSILYGSQQCRSGSYPKEPTVLLRIDEDAVTENGLPGSQRTMLCTGTDVREHKTSLSTQELPTVSNIPLDEDALDLTLRYLGSTSPECLLHSGEALNAAFHAPLQLSSNVEQQMMDVLLQQQLDEGKHVRTHNCDQSMSSTPMKPLDSCDAVSPFHLCRLFFSQMGYMVWEKRKQFDLLHKSEKLLRELKHLDSQRCRETHKIAVIYIGPGQEDKVSILNNTFGSRLFEEFVAALGWQVDLQSHSGFMGGLQRNRMTGSMAPYYATSTKEVIFHVSTQMPSETEEDQLRMLKHLGNDEVHIIWSEHRRDYRRGIIPTEFGDVLIIIYPLENGLFRIQIKRRPEVPFFGPLFDGAIVDFQVLPGLVRATAINAGQMLRSQKPHYQPFYEERMRYIDNIVQKYKMLTMFEMFSSQIFAPDQQIGEESLAPPPASLNNGQPQQLTKVAKEEHAALAPRKLSLVGGKTKKMKKLQAIQSSSTPPRSPSFDTRHNK